jgi:hypothetical protein
MSIVRQSVVDAIRKVADDDGQLSDQDYVDAMTASRDEMRAAFPTWSNACIEDALISNAARIQQLANMTKGNTFH